MPYEWLPPSSGERRLHLWPHRSLSPHGFVAFIGATAGLIALPAVTVLGSPVLWALLPFFALAVGGVWWAIRRNQRDTEIIEDLVLGQHQVTLTRHGPRGRRQDWQANPHWVRVRLHPTGGPVPHYLTLKGEGREVELGAFLSEDERIALCAELDRALGLLR
jgi:uncharacterized membrane protein